MRARLWQHCCTNLTSTEECRHILTNSWPLFPCQTRRQADKETRRWADCKLRSAPCLPFSLSEVDRSYQIGGAPGTSRWNRISLGAWVVEKNGKALLVM